MPFLAKHVQLRQVKTSHAEVLAQDAESEQQRRGTVGVCRLSMKIELNHHYTRYHGTGTVCVPAPPGVFLPVPVVPSLQFTDHVTSFQVPVSSIMDDDVDDDDDDHNHISQGELRARVCVNSQLLGARLSPEPVYHGTGTGTTIVLHAVHFLVHA